MVAEINTPLNNLRDAITEINIKNGWFDRGRVFADDLMLIDTESAEAYEEYRKNHAPNELYFMCKTCGTVSSTFEPCPECETYLEPKGIPIELIDIIIRVLDTCERYSIDADAMMHLKLEYNRTREYRHGGKRT